MIISSKRTLNLDPIIRLTVQVLPYLQNLVFYGTELPHLFIPGKYFLLLTKYSRITLFILRSFFPLPSLKYLSNLLYLFLD